MMFRKNVYCVVNSLADDVVADVFTAPKDIMALYGFKKFLESVKDAGTPKGYKLIQIGEFCKQEEELPDVVPLPKSVVVATGVNVDDKITCLEEEVE